MTIQTDRGVNGVKSVLLQVNHVDDGGFLQQQIVFRGDAFLAGHLHHLVHRVTAMQQLDYLGNPVAPARLQVGVEPPAKLLEVARPTQQRINGGIETLVGPLGRQPQKGLDRAQGGLGDGLFKVPSGRRYRADHGQGPDRAIVAAQHAGALVNSLDARIQIGREAFISRDLLQPAGGLAHRLRPARRGVGDQQHVKPHLSVVFAKRHAGIDRRFAGGHRHGGGVGDNDGALHQGSARAGVLHLGKFFDGFHHLAGALAAGHHNHHIHIGIARNQVLQHGLAGAERPGNAGGSAAGDGKEGVDQPQGGGERLIGIEAL